MSKISPAQELEVISVTEQWLQQACELFQYSFQSIDVHFDLKGRAAGMYQNKNRQRCIRYNPYLFVKYFQDNLANTVPHEVAHYIVDVLYGIEITRPHGKEWKQVMNAFGVDARVTCSYDLDDIPVRQYQRVAYRCACREHQLTLIRHKRILKGARYQCRNCRQALKQRCLNF